MRSPVTVASERTGTRCNGSDHSTEKNCHRKDLRTEAIWRLPYRLDKKQKKTESQNNRLLTSDKRTVFVGNQRRFGLKTS